MVRSKPSSKKQSTRGVDFKKIKRKIGRKLPQPKNATNTEIKSKAIILPEQSVAADKTGLAVSRKGLTLKELLQQTSHHNAKVRKDALVGVKDLFQRHPAELKLHKLAVFEKLRERISDDDKLVRETLYQLFKSIVLPGCKEDNLGPLISLAMGYVFNAMTNFSLDVRLMAFKFLDLFVQHHPSTFTKNAEKVLQNYEDILRMNKFHLEDRAKLKIALSGIMRCLSILSSNEKDDPCAKNIAERHLLHAYEHEVRKDSAGYLCVIRRLKDIVPLLVRCFDDFISMVYSQSLLDGQSCDCMLSILQSIDYAVRYFAYGEEIYQKDPTSMPLVGTDITLNESFLPSLKKLFGLFPLTQAHNLSKKDYSRYFVLDAVISEIFLNLSQRISPPPLLLARFLEFVEDVLKKLSDDEQSVEAFSEKHLLSLISFLPRLMSTVDYSSGDHLLQAFTNAFKDCYGTMRATSDQASTKRRACLLPCVIAIREMLLPHYSTHLDANDPNLHDYLSTWIETLPQILISLGYAHPSFSKVVLSLLLCLGQVGSPNTFLGLEYNKIQTTFQELFGGGIFLKLPKDCQELSICCIYYFSLLDRSFLTSVATCCLSHDLDSDILSRIIGVLNSAYKAGHIRIEDHFSFFITLLSQFEVTPELYEREAMSQEGKRSNREIFKSITGVIGNFLHQMGHPSLIFQLLESVVIKRLASPKLPFDNKCAMLRMLAMVVSKPAQFSQESIANLSKILSGYLLELAICFPEEIDKRSDSVARHTCNYYLLPCLFMIDRSTELFKAVLDTMKSVVFVGELEACHKFNEIAGDPSIRIWAIVLVFSMVFKDLKIWRSIFSFKQEIDGILESIISLQSKEEASMSLEQRHKAKCAVEKLKILKGALL